MALQVADLPLELQVQPQPFEPVPFGSGVAAPAVKDEGDGVSPVRHRLLGAPLVNRPLLSLPHLAGATTLIVTVATDVRLLLSVLDRVKV